MEHHDDERAEFISTDATLLDCVPANFDHAEGEEATVLTFAYQDVIGNFSLTLDDTRKLTLKLLVSLWTADDSFAGSLLENHFPSTEDDDFCWPGFEDIDAPARALSGVLARARLL